MNNVGSIQNSGRTAGPDAVSRNESGSGRASADKLEAMTHESLTKSMLNSNERSRNESNRSLELRPPSTFDFEDLDPDNRPDPLSPNEDNNLPYVIPPGLFD